MELGTAFKKLIDSFGSEVLRDNIRLKNCFRDLFVKDSVHYFLCMQMVRLNIFIKFYNADKDKNKSFKQQTASECVEILCDQLLLSRDASINAINALCSALGWRGVSVSLVNSGSVGTTLASASSFSPPASKENCPSCSKPVPSEMKYCFYCSSDMSGKRKCSSCGKLMDLDVLFCGYCGNKMDSSHSSSASSGRPSVSSSLSVGDIIEFGRYPQDSDGTEKPIKWKILAIENGRALLFSEYGLDCVLYHNKWSAITWEDCDLRRWLNKDFYNKVFNSSEQSKIAEVCLKNADNPKFGTDGGIATYDKVFCLSIAEAEKYFPADGERGDEIVNDYRCRKATVYAAEQGVYFYEYDSNDECAIPAYDGNCVFWLRSPGYDASSAAFVGDYGFVISSGSDVRSNDVAACPALWVNL